MSTILVSGTKLPHRARRGDDQFLRAQLHRLDLLALAAQRAAGELLALVAALVLFSTSAQNASMATP